MSTSSPDLLASWAVPLWATSSVAEDGGVRHSRALAVLGFLPDLHGGPPTVTDVLLVQVDDFEVVEGRIRVVRGAPEINVDGQRLTLPGAAELAAALAELVALGRGEC